MRFANFLPKSVRFSAISILFACSQANGCVVNRWISYKRLHYGVCGKLKGCIFTCCK